MGHESYERRDDIKGSSERSFGIVFAVVFALIGLWPLAFGRDPRLWSLAVGAAFLVCAFVLPSLLAPLNRLWLRFGLLLHRIVSPLVLGIMFYLVITPTGLLMRAVGKDPLRLKLDRNLATYWIERVPPGPPPESFKDQF
jgi:predicted membrane metal-binding protein